MLLFTLKYRTAIDGLMLDRTTGLQTYELNDTDWHIIKDLQDVLKVHFSHLCNHFYVTHTCLCTGPEAHYSVLLVSNTKPRSGHPSYGPH